MYLTPSDIRWLFSQNDESDSTAPQKYKIRETLRKIDHTLRVLSDSDKLHEFESELLLLSYTFSKILEKLSFEEIDFIRVDELPDREQSDA